MSERQNLSVEDQMPQAAIGVPLIFAVPWLLGLVIVYLLKAVIYVVGILVVLVVVAVGLLRSGR